MMLNFAAYVFAFLAYYAVGYAFQFGAVAINAAPTHLGRVPSLNQFLLGSGRRGGDRNQSQNRRTACLSRVRAPPKAAAQHGEDPGDELFGSVRLG